MFHNGKEICEFGAMGKGMGWGLGGGGQRGRNGDICNNVNNKNKTLKKEIFEFSG